ncbi:MAG: 6-phosphofructokinase [Firmicutes bacterium]|nr:6-phosphofructokinase [Bacillota bacterium]
MRRIALLTSGGDAPGMNATIRAVVRYAINNARLDVFGVERGYEGLIKGSLQRMDSRSVSGIINRGGTILKTARCPEFATEKGLETAHEVLKAFGIDGLIVIGGDGSLRGMGELYAKYKFPCIGIPGTIDNDLGYTDYTLGFDTTVNTVLSAIGNIRDTMTSHDRACILEVMGRECGDIALYAGLAGGAETMLIPEMPIDIDKVVAQIKRNIIKGKASDIIVLAEGVSGCEELKQQIKEKFNMTIRTVKLGYIQRGGIPSAQDRIFGARCAVRAVDLLTEGKHGRAVGLKDNKIIDVDIDKALKAKREVDKEIYRIAGLLS